MIHRILLLFLLFFSVKIPFMHAQSDAHIMGHIIDTQTGEHLPYYPVKLAGTSIGTVTDATGHYVLRNIRPGDYNIEVAMIGYSAQTKSVTVSAGKTVEIDLMVVPDAFMLDQVVVTGSKSETKRRSCPVLVNVVTDKLFNMVNASSLADGLSFQPGVRVENDCQNCGFTQVRINGLDGHYSQILMNSRPVFSALTGVYGLEQIPANMIDRVEVMRGGGSAIFGASAIGGTINIITKDPSANYAEVSHALTSVGISGSLDNNTTFNASVVSNDSRLGLTVYGQSRNRDGYDHDGDTFTEIGQIRARTLGFRTYARPGDNQRITAEYHTTHEYRRGGDQLDRVAHEAMIAEQIDHNINTGEMAYDIWSTDRESHINIFGAIQNTHRKSYYGSGQDPDAYGRTHDLVVTSGAQWTRRLGRLIFMPSEFIAGLEYSHNRLHDISEGYSHDVTQIVNIYSGYLQNEWRNDRFGFLIGARIDKHSMISDAVISPRVNLRYNPSDEVNFRLSYSTGFRAPQAYDEDFHIAVVGGERVVTVLAAGLKEENSNSISGSADLYHTFGTIQTNLMVEGFYTDLSDVFAMRKLDQTDEAGNTVLERYNGSGAYVAGVNVEAKAIFPGKIQLQSGLTWQSSRYKKPEQWSENTDVAPVKRMFRTPDLYGYLTLNYDITRQFKATLTGTYTGRMLVQHMEGSGTDIDRAVETPRFFDANLRLSYEVKVFNTACLEFSLGVMNIFNSYQNDFDKGYMRDSGYIYGPSLPRSLTAGLRLHI